MEQKQEKQEQAAKPNFVFTDDRWGTYTKDNRKDRLYYRHASVAIDVFMTHDKHREIELFRLLDEGRHVGGWWFVRLDVQRQIEEKHGKKYSGNFSSQWNSSHKDESSVGFGYDRRVTFYIDRRFKADKPSQIISEKEANAAFLEDGIDRDLPLFVALALAKVTELMAAEERARVGNVICSQYANIISERAKKAVRWSQRLTALEAEFKAEVEEQAVQLLNELGDGQLGFEFQDNYEPDPRSVAAAKEHLPKVAAEMKPPTRRRLMPRGLTEDQGPVTAEDVK